MNIVGHGVWRRGVWNGAWRARALCAVAALALIAGCAVDRPKLSEPELVELRDRTLADMRLGQQISSARLVDRMALELGAYETAKARGEPAEPPALDFLVLSGGGDFGSFGVGVLNGWGDVEGELARPSFDCVTGVSTGALIAPFAFLGDDESYRQIYSLYTEPKDDWVVVRSVLFFWWPWRDSFTDTKGLRRDLEAQLTPDKIRKLAASDQDHRLLAIGTTNLDLGVMRGWDLVRQASLQIEQGRDFTKIYDILMASAAIPGAFPPVEIDGSLYVDGGTTANILFGTNLRAPEQLVGVWKSRHAGRTPAKLRFWVIVNNQLGVQPVRVEPRWPSIVKHSLSTAIRFSTIASLRNLAAQAELLRYEGFDAEFRYLSIPADFVPPVEGTFKKETMAALARIGEELARDPANWRTTLPDQ